MMSFVVAYTRNFVIGKAGTMPWHLPNDLRHFQQLTTGHTIVMGRKTFDSIGKPLPHRTNLVVTTQQDFSHPGITVVHHLDDILQFEDIFVIGGAQIFTSLLDIVDRMYITKIQCELAGDTFFPVWDEQKFQLISSSVGMKDEKNQLPHTFCVYDRIRPPENTERKRLM